MVELYANRRLRLNLCKFISNSIFSNFIDDFDIGHSLATFKSDYFKAIIMRFTRTRSKKKKKKFKKAHHCVEISDARASREAEWPIASRPHFIGPQAFAATSSFSTAPQRGGAFEKRSLVRRGVPSFPRCESRSQQFRAWQ